MRHLFAVALFFVGLAFLCAGVMFTPATPGAAAPLGSMAAVVVGVLCMVGSPLLFMRASRRAAQR